MKILSCALLPIFLTFVVRCCDELAMERHAVHELKSMEHSWILRRSGLLSDNNRAQLSYEAKLLDQHPRCLMIAVNAKRWSGDKISGQHERGGTSFYASVIGAEARMCAIENHLNDSYIISCARPSPGTCATVKVVVGWEHFQAFHNSEPGGGSISAKSGGVREEPHGRIFEEIVCEPQKEIAAGRIPLRGASWVRLNESGVDATRAAAWQAPWIWRDKLGSYQNYSQSRSSDYKRCFEEKSGRQLFVDLLGDSHLNYAGWCLAGELLHFTAYPHKKGSASTLKGGAEDSAVREMERMGRFDMYAKNGPKWRNESAYEEAARCAPHGQQFWNESHDYCIGFPRGMLENKLVNCFFEMPSISIKMCISKLTTLETVTTSLRLMRLNFDPSAEPWGPKHVAVIVIGHWDAASQRDVRDFLLDELPRFFAAVEELRSDRQTEHMRIVIDIGPAFGDIAYRSTGWRNTHALAAAASFIRREINSQPQLRIEILEPSFLSLTIPRLHETVDQLHYMKVGDPAHSKQDLITGDDRYCDGPIGEAFNRKLLDFLCQLN